MGKVICRQTNLWQTNHCFECRVILELSCIFCQVHHFLQILLFWYYVNHIKSFVHGQTLSLWKCEFMYQFWLRSTKEKIWRITHFAFIFVVLDRVEQINCTLVNYALCLYHRGKTLINIILDEQHFVWSQKSIKHMQNMLLITISCIIPLTHQMTINARFNIIGFT